MSKPEIPARWKPRYNTLVEWLTQDAVRRNMSPVLKGLAEDELRLIEELGAAEATIERLSQKVTDEEWEELCAGTPVNSRVAECFISRNGLDSWIASRKGDTPKDPK